MKKKNLVFPLCFMALSAPTYGQELQNKGTLSTDIKFGALFDLYYLYSPGRSQEGTSISNRNYDRKNNDFTVNLVEFNVSGSVEQVDFYADLDFGDFADQNTSHAGDGINHHIGQAHLTYNFSDSLSLAAGKMYTHVGYEVAKAIDNWNYSRSFAFSLGGPFWHEGLALKYFHGSGFNAGAFVYDNWDSSTENNSDKTYGLQLGYTTEKFLFLFNTIHGAETSSSAKKKTVFEFNTQYQLMDNLAIALNGVIGSDEDALTSSSGTGKVDKEWNAWVLYLNWRATEKWSFTPRFEIFSDKSSGAAGNQYIFSSMGATQANDITSITLTTSYQASRSTQFRFEVRNDSADQNIWVDGQGKAKDSLNSLAVAWLMKI